MLKQPIKDINKNTIKQHKDLVDFVAMCKKQYNFVQRDGEWFKSRKTIIGGSEVSVIKGMNRYKNIFELMEGKLGIVGRQENIIACCWGNVFEDLAQEFIETLCRTKVIGTTIWVHNEKFMKEFGYSPDGLAVLKIRHNNNTQEVYCDRSIDKNLNLIKYPYYKYIKALMEFKCPFGNISIKSVNDNYIAQVKSGLDIMDNLVDTGVLAQCIFRLCKKSQYNDFCGYNYKLHCSLNPSENKKEVLKRYKPIAIGIIIVTQKKDDKTDYTNISIRRAIELISAGVLNEYFSRMRFSSRIERYNLDYDVSQTKVNGEKIVKTLPWKLLKYSINIIKKTKNYVKDEEPGMKRIINFIKENMDKDLMTKEENLETWCVKNLNKNFSLFKI